MIRELRERIRIRRGLKMKSGPPGTRELRRKGFSPSVSTVVFFVGDAVFCFSLFADEVGYALQLAK